jgi:hypothetical protein
MIDTMSRIKIGLFLVAAGLLGLSLIFAFAPTIHGDFSRPPNTKASWHIWPALTLGFTGSGLLYWYSKRPSTRFVATFSFSLMFYFYFFFYHAFGSDVGGILAVMRDFAGEDHVSSTLGSYSAWPSFYILSKQLSVITSLPLSVVLKVIFLVIITLLSASFTMLFSENDSRRFPLMPAFVFFVSSYVFLNWQSAPQTIGLVMLLLYFSATAGARRRWVIGVPFFLFIVSDHGFVSLWFLGVLASYVVMHSLSNASRISSNPDSRFLIVAAIFEIGYMLFLASGFLGSFVDTLTATLNPADTSGGPIPVTSSLFMRSLPFQPGEDIVVSISKTLGVMVVLSTVFLVIAGVPNWLRSRNVCRQEKSFMAVGFGHISLGSFLPLLGARGLQLCAVSIARVAGYTRVVPKHVFLAIIVLILALLPVNLIRVNVSTTLYIDYADNAASEWFRASTILNASTTNWLCTAGVLGSATLGRSAENWVLCSANFPPPLESSVSPESIFEISTPKYQYELYVADNSATRDLQNISAEVHSQGNRLYDNGEVKVYFIVGSVGLGNG